MGVGHNKETPWSLRNLYLGSDIKMQLEGSESGRDNVYSRISCQGKKNTPASV